jgi:RNA polymerase sigma factor (sigma-70 family)
MELTVSAAPRLSPREREVLRLIAEGCTYLQVARRIGISTHTVSTYLRRIREKTDAQTLAELVRLALTFAP